MDKQRNKKLNALSWENRLFFLIIIVFSMIALFQLSYAIPEVKNQVLETEVEHQKELARLYAMELEANIIYISEKMLDIAQSTEFRSMDIDAQGSILKNVAEGSYRINTLMVLDDKGYFVSSCNNDNLSAYTSKSYADQSYFSIPINKGEVFYGSPRFYPKSEILSLSISVPIESYSGEKVGVLIGSIDLREMVNHIYSNPLEERTAFMLDREGVVFAHSEIDVFELKEGPRSLDFSSDPLVQNFMTGSAVQSLQHNHGDIPYFSTYTTLEKTGFGIIVGCPMNLLLASSEKLSSRMIQVNAIVLLFLLAGSLYITKHITSERMRTDVEIRTLNAELEWRVVKRTAQLEAANRELESFTYSVSHDLRVPLRAINGFLRILIEDFGKQLPKDAQRYLDIMWENSGKMGALIDGLLLFSRTGKRILRTQEIDCTVIAKQTLSALQPEREGREIEVVVGKLPACRADPILLKQVWVNLLSNAFKFTKGKKNARVEIGSKKIKGEKVYFVKDNGVGFDMRYADKLYVVFQRLHSTADFEGTGVGLAIVQRIIHHHGGKVWAEAEVDKGATFYFTVGENDEN